MTVVFLFKAFARRAAFFVKSFYNLLNQLQSLHDFVFLKHSAGRQH